MLELSRVRRRKTKSTDARSKSRIPSSLGLCLARRRKAKPKDWLGFRIGSVLGKHIAHRCLLDKIKQDGRIDVLAILYFLKQRCLLITSKHPVIMKKSY